MLGLLDQITMHVAGVQQQLYSLSSSGHFHHVFLALCGHYSMIRACVNQKSHVHDDIVVLGDPNSVIGSMDSEIC
jgi:hypothetical protein